MWLGTAARIQAKKRSLTWSLALDYQIGTRVLYDSPPTVADALASPETRTGGGSDTEAQRRLVEFGNRVLISILGIQIFDMIDAVVGNLEKVPLTERCSEIARSVIADYDEMRHDSENEGMRGLDSCYARFDRELRAEVDACGEE